MALFSKILIFYVIGVNISFVIIWFISHEKTHIRLLSAFLVGITWPMSLPVALLDWPPESPDNQYHLFK